MCRSGRFDAWSSSNFWYARPSLRRIVRGRRAPSYRAGSRCACAAPPSRSSSGPSSAWLSRGPPPARRGRRPRSRVPPAPCAIASAPSAGVSRASPRRASATTTPASPRSMARGRERRHAGRLDPAVEGLVVGDEALVVRAIPRLVDVEQRHDEARALVVAAHAARRLDVLGASSSAGPQHHHEAEPLDVDADGDHVAGERHVHGACFFVASRCEALLRREREPRLASFTSSVGSRLVSSTHS